MDLYQLSVVVSYCLLSEGLFKGRDVCILVVYNGLYQLFMNLIDFVHLKKFLWIKYASYDWKIACRAISIWGVNLLW